MCVCVCVCVCLSVCLSVVVDVVFLEGGIFVCLLLFCLFAVVFVVVLFVVKYSVACSNKIVFKPTPGSNNGIAGGRCHNSTVAAVNICCCQLRVYRVATTSFATANVQFAVTIYFSF